VSSSPGKTITINFYDVDKKLFLVDLPGYGFAKRSANDKSKWSSLTDGYFTANPKIDMLKLVIQLVDSRIGPTNDDEMMLDFMNNSDIPYIIVATKSDKLNATERKKSIETITSNPYILPNTPIIYFSSLKNEGKNELWSEIFKHTNL
jgi:GTP-binding protein